MLGNNGRTKNDRYQKAALKGTKISTKHIHRNRAGDKNFTRLHVCVSRPKGLGSIVLYILSYSSKKRSQHKTDYLMFNNRAGRKTSTIFLDLLSIRFLDEIWCSAHGHSR